jgi:ATP-dependent RNA helicase DeaD
VNSIVKNSPPVSQPAVADAAHSDFSQLSLDPKIQAVLKQLKFEKPTPIQGKAIPVAISKKDLIGCAQTGTGKTLAFALPMIHRIMNEPEAKGKCLILVPTRELGIQIEEVIRNLAKKLNIEPPVLLIGGVSYVHQFRALRAPYRIVVSTPGRTIDHLQQRTLDLRNVQCLVLDEADRMLDVGFKPQLNEILTYLKTGERQTMMFTATMTAGVRELASKYLKNPVMIQAQVATGANPNIQQKMIEARHDQKTDRVLDLLKANPGTALLFVKTQSKTEKIARKLVEFGVAAAPIHGGLSQGQRKQALDSFRKKISRVLVATDVAARGLDIDHVNLVINYDLPQVAEDYVHRIGRTGRAERKGLAVSLVAGDDRGMWKAISRLYLRP